MNNQRLRFLAGFVCVVGAASVANAADPPAPTVPDDSIAAQAKAVGLTIEHDAQELAKAVKEQAKKVSAAAQQGAKQVQATVKHQVKGTDTKKTEDKKAEDSPPPK